MTELNNPEYRPSESLAELVEQYQRVSEPDNVLTIGRLGEELPEGHTIMQTERFQRVVEAVDWPSDLEDGALTRRQAYRSPDDFAYYLSQSAGDPEKGLNNFHLYLRLKPHRPDESSDAGLFSASYTTTPAFMRGYAVAPKLFDAVRGQCEQVSRIEIGDVMQRRPELAAASLSVYQLMGRLVKADDNNLQIPVINRLFPTMPEVKEFPPIVDIHQLLRR